MCSLRSSFALVHDHEKGEDNAAALRHPKMTRVLCETVKGSLKRPKRHPYTYNYHADDHFTSKEADDEDRRQLLVSVSEFCSWTGKADSARNALLQAMRNPSYLL